MVIDLSWHGYRGDLGRFEPFAATHEQCAKNVMLHGATT